MADKSRHHWTFTILATCTSKDAEKVRRALEEVMDWVEDYPSLDFYSLSRQNRGKASAA